MVPIKLFVIDDHAVTLLGLFQVFDIDQHGIKVIGSSLTIDEPVNHLPDPMPDVILLDLFLGDQDPVKNLERLRNSFPSTPIIIYSCDTSICWQVKMFQHGVNAYLSKGAEPNCLIETIQRVSQNETIISSEISDILLARDSSSRENQLPEEFCELIHMLANGYSYKEIAKKLRKSPSAVTKQLALIRSIFKVKSNVELALKVMTNRIPH